MTSRVIFRENIMEQPKQEAFEELLERAQILIDHAYDGLAEGIHQHQRMHNAGQEILASVEKAKAALSTYATKRELYISLGIVALAFYCVGYWAHG